MTAPRQTMLRDSYTVPTFRKMLDEWSEKNADYTAPIKSIEYALNNKRLVKWIESEKNNELTTELFPGIQQTSEYSGMLADHAFRQILGRYKAEKIKPWLDSEDCPSDLQAFMMKRLGMRYLERMEQKGGKMRDHFMIRTRKESPESVPDIRAILSAVYGIFDNHTMLSVFEKAVARLDGTVNIYRPTFGDQLRFFAVMEDISFSIPDNANGRGSNFKPANYVFNSEIGDRGIGLAKAAFNLVCLNGAYTLEKEDFYFYRSHAWIDTESIERQFATGLAKGFQMSEELAIAFIQSIEIRVTDDAKKLSELVNAWSKKYHISKPISENWLSGIKVESSRYGQANDVRMHDVLQAGTELSQTLDLDDRENMEVACGKMLKEMVIVPLRRASQTFADQLIFK